MVKPLCFRIISRVKYINNLYQVYHLLVVFVLNCIILQTMFKYKRPVKCRNLPGLCPYGSSCKFAHSDIELMEAKKKVISKKAAAYTKQCRNGQMCPYKNTTCMFIHNKVDSSSGMDIEITGGVITKESLLGSFSKVSDKMSGSVKVSNCLSLVNTFNNCLSLVNISLGQEGGSSEDSGASTVIILKSSGTRREGKDIGGDSGDSE